MPAIPIARNGRGVASTRTPSVALVAVKAWRAAIVAAEGWSRSCATHQTFLLAKTNVRNPFRRCLCDIEDGTRKMNRKEPR